MLRARVADQLGFAALDPVVHGAEHRRRHGHRSVAAPAVNANLDGRTRIGSRFG
jgi:hypothetical protein